VASSPNPSPTALSNPAPATNTDGSAQDEQKKPNATQEKKDAVATSADPKQEPPKPEQSKPTSVPDERVQVSSLEANQVVGDVAIHDPKPEPKPESKPEPKLKVASAEGELKAATTSATTSATASTTSHPELKPKEATSSPTDLPSLHLQVLLGGEAFVAPLNGTTSAEGGNAWLDLGIGERFGVTLGGGLDTTMSATNDPGRIDVSRSDFELAGRADVNPLPDANGHVRLQVGVLLERLSAQAQGYLVNDKPVERYEPGLGLSVRWEQPVYSGLDFWAGPTLRLWLQQDTFQVVEDPSGQGPVYAYVQTPAFWLGLALGLGWRFF
jgi:hypothetical protein